MVNFPLSACLGCQGAAGCKWLVLCVPVVSSYARKLQRVEQQLDVMAFFMHQCLKQHIHSQVDPRCRGGAGAASAASQPATCAAISTST